MQPSDDHKAPDGYTFPFPTAEDNYTFGDFQEDGDHFALLHEAGASLYELANKYFGAHYPPGERAQRCLNLYWKLQSFLAREFSLIGASDDRIEQAAWQFYSSQGQGLGITDDSAVEAISNILLKEGHVTKRMLSEATGEKHGDDGDGWKPA
jgi:hypothetical protein